MGLASAILLVDAVMQSRFGDSQPLLLRPSLGQPSRKRDSSLRQKAALRTLI